MRRAVLLVAALGVVYLLKSHYRAASTAELDWILSPTVWLVEAVTRIGFEYEPAGYISTQSRFVIAPVCAGVNFLSAAFLTGCVALGRCRRLPLVFVGSLAGAYLATLLANTLRIAVALKLHASHLGFPGLSGEATHRLLGVVVYVSCLCALFLAAQRLAPQVRNAG